MEVAAERRSVCAAAGVRRETSDMANWTCPVLPSWLLVVEGLLGGVSLVDEPQAAAVKASALTRNRAVMALLPAHDIRAMACSLPRLTQVGPSHTRPRFPGEGRPGLVGAPFRV